MKVEVRSSLGDLADGLGEIAGRCKPDMVQCVRRNAQQGADLAKRNARTSAGSHGKRYPNSITMTPTGLLSCTYGPDPAMPQGGMSFEGGSRNQPPHRDLARSLEVQGPKFRRDVADLPDKWFWP